MRLDTTTLPLTLLPLVCGTAVGYATVRNAKVDYSRVRKPSWSPPSYAFGIVWPILYLLMGFASWMVYASGSPHAHLGLWLFAAQLFLNLAWSPVYFGLGDRKAALAIILALDVAVLATALQFSRSSALAAGLLAPYIAWIAYATALNYEIVRLHPTSS